MKAMGAGPTGRITYAAGGRLDGIGRRAIGDMVSSAVASSFEMIGTLPRRSNPAIIAGIFTADKPVQVHAILIARHACGSASGSGPRVGEWLCNDLDLVLVHDISDVRFMDHGHNLAV